MGRTVPSWRMLIEEEMKRWGKFRDALRAEDKEVFEDLLNQCRLYASAAGAMASPIKLEPMFLSILFAHHKILRELEKKLKGLST